MRGFWLTAALLALPAALSAQSHDAPLDELLNVPISAAAKYEQRLADVPASVTIISRDDIDRFGYESLQDVLQAIRGVYLSYDRNYTYLGLRGFSRPTDYNNRTLLLIDGHPMTDNVWGGNPIGTELLLDLSAVERIEFIRGPSSALYGTGAMFAVINVVTRRQHDRSEASVDAGSLRTHGGTLHGAETFGADASAEATLLWRNAGGAKRVYFPEFDSPLTNRGVAQDLDYDNAHGGVGSLHFGGFSLTGYYGSRTKAIPTGPWGATFDALSKTTDTRSFVELTSDRNFGNNRKLSGRVSFDQLNCYGLYANAFEETSHGRWVTVEERLRWDVRPNQRLILGGDYQRSFKADYTWWGTTSGTFAKPFSVASLYGQDEYQPHSRLTLIGGIRQDRYSYAGSVTSPRLAVVFHPNGRRTFKLLAGTAHRVPNLYEMYLDDYAGGVKAASVLHPEKVRTLEAVWEERLTPAVFATASLYEFHATGLIEQRLDRQDYLWQYHNAASAHAKGAEVQLDYRASRLWSYVSYAFQDAESEGEWLTNSPRHLARAGVTAPLAGRGNASAEVQYDSGRKTIAGDVTGGFFDANLSLSWRLGRHLQLRTTLRNALNEHYATPGGVEHREDAIVQDGRTWQTRVTWTF